MLASGPQPVLHMPSESIVVVDDSPTLSKLIQLVLGEMGLQVIAANSAAAARDLLKTEHPRLVLLDDVIDDQPIDGLCEYIAALAPKPPGIVLLRSGRGPEDLSRLAGVVDSITKPFSPDALKALVSHIVGLSLQEGPSLPRRRLMLTPSPDFTPRKLTDEQTALSGTLAVFGAAEILGLLGEGHRTGVAMFAQQRTTIRVRFGKGRIDYARAEGVQEEFLLGRFLVDRAFISAAQLQTVAQQLRQSQGTKPRLGEMLIEKGLLTTRELTEGMRQQSLALVYELLRWDNGTFSFVQKAEPNNANEFTLGLVVDQLLMEGLRRIDEWRIIEREVNNFDEVFLREEERMAAMGPGKLLREEIAVAELLNGRNTVKDVIFQSHMGSFDVCRVLYRLLKSKLVRALISPSAPQ